MFNPNDAPVTGVDVTDQLSNGTVCTVPGGGNATVPSGDTTFAYSCAVGSVPEAQLDNTATATWPAQTLDPDGALAAGSDHFTFEGITFTRTTIDECVDVTDTFDGGTAAALGTVCVGGANPTSFAYSRTIAIQQVTA